MLTSSRSFTKHKAVSHRTVERRKANAFNGEARVGEKAPEGLGIGRDLGLPNDLALAVEDADCTLLRRDIDANIVHGGSSGSCAIAHRRAGASDPLSRRETGPPE